MEEKIHSISITVHNREAAFVKVSTILHNYAPYIKLRVGYPIEDKNAAVIFLVTQMNGDVLGAFSGKLGQIKTVDVKAVTLKI